MTGNLLTRRMRTRMPGGVGGGSESLPPTRLSPLSIRSVFSPFSSSMNQTPRMLLLAFHVILNQPLRIVPKLSGNTPPSLAHTAEGIR
jgi:hypothetical protein